MENLPSIINQNNDPATIAAAASVQAKIQSAFQMALYRPRNEDSARASIIKACKRSSFAESAKYTLEVSGRSLSGPSIRLMEVAMRYWGNIMTETHVIHDGPEYRRINVTVIDLETNTHFSKEIQIKKTVERKYLKGREHDEISRRKNSYGNDVYILRATEEEIHMTEKSLISKTVRNEARRLIPTDIIEEAMAAADAVISSNIKQDPDGAKKTMVDAFSGLGIPPTEIEKYLGHSLSTITEAEIKDLKPVYRALREGESKWTDYVQKSEPRHSQAIDTEKLKAELSKPKATTATTPEPEREEFTEELQESFQRVWDMNPEFMKKAGELNKINPSEASPKQAKILMTAVGEMIKRISAK